MTAAPQASVHPGTGSQDTAASAPQRILLLGGSSEIGLAILRRLSSARTIEAHLLGRDLARTESAMRELEGAGCRRGEVGVLEARDLASHAGVIEGAFQRSGGFDVVVLAIGVLGGQAGLDTDRAEAIEVMEVDFLASGSLLLECLRHLRAQGHGQLVVLSSVGAERPRASNPIYGAAKAGLDALAQGLADSTAGTGVGVLVVRPGFVRTRMTAGLKPTPMSTTAEEVATATARGLASGAHTVWVPGRLRLVFAVLRHVPRPLFRRLPL
jgi:decaprenylphospho-beta-D-erythro-pentofuranosid-2-ulose 2-reductase